MAVAAASSPFALGRARCWCLVLLALVAPTAAMAGAAPAGAAGGDIQIDQAPAAGPALVLALEEALRAVVLTPRLSGASSAAAADDAWTYCSRRLLAMQ